jgi:REP element-mobilizing transposase RayT
MGRLGWRSRGYLPHFDSPGRTQSLTIHLHDSLPGHVLERIKGEVSELPEPQRKVEFHHRIEKWLDTGFGACLLARPEIAQALEDHLLVSDGIMYRLIEWPIMPNHAHVLAYIEEGTSLGSVMQKMKGGSSIVCNRLLGRTGTFWFREYHDRFIRNEDHYWNAVDYIRDNPVKAGLCSHSRDWPFGSARLADPGSWGQ